MPVYRNKVMRGPSGNFYTKKLVESSPEDLAKASPDEIWTAGTKKDQRQILVRDMDTKHIINAMRLLENRVRTERRVKPDALTVSYADIEMPVSHATGIMYPIYKYMTNELERRINPKQEPPKRNRAIELE